MITILTKLFLKNPTDYKSPETRNAYGMLCGFVGIFLNLILFIGKFLAGTISNSIAITADAFNNLSDAVSSFITLIGFKLSSAEPDPEHPFGHGRIEYVAGLVVSGIIILMAIELIRDSIDKILHPLATDFNYLSLLILTISILVKIYMCCYNKSIAKKIDSAAMNATATDSLSDSVATFVVLLSTIIGHLTNLQIDGFCGVLVGCFIFYAGISAAKDTLNPLLGQPADPEFVKEIEDLVMSHEGVLGIHDLIVHDYGPGRLMVTLHAEVPAEGDILSLHDVIDNIEVELRQTLKCAATIHLDPVETTNELSFELKEKTAVILKEIDPELQFHDFRIVTGPTHTNLIYDVLVPYHYKLTDSELITTLKEQTTAKIGSQYFLVVTVDRAFT